MIFLIKKILNSESGGENLERAQFWVKCAGDFSSKWTPSFWFLRLPSGGSFMEGPPRIEMVTYEGVWEWKEELDNINRGRLLCVDGGI